MFYNLIRRTSVWTLLGATLLLGVGTLSATTVTICKVSDPSAPVTGIPFTFTVDGSLTLTLAAAPSPGTCDSRTYTEGNHAIVEEVVTGTELVSIAVTPPDRLVSFNLTTRTVTVEALNDPVATVVTFVNRRQPGAQGCTPGYWKNHTDSFAPTGYTPGTIVGTVFTGLLPSLATQTFLTALQGGGGSGELGAQQILLRAAVAALLNAAHPSVSYALTTAEITSLVNAALATHDRATILALASRLDAANNGSGGCPLN